MFVVSVGMYIRKTCPKALNVPSVDVRSLKTSQIMMMSSAKHRCAECGSTDIEWTVDLDDPTPWDYYTCLECDYIDQKNYFKGRQ